MPWKETTKMSEKEKFVNQVLAEIGSFSSICKSFNISRTTGYKILKKHTAEGTEGLSPRSKMPLSSPNKTPQEVTDQILFVRRKHTTWGARKIITYLKKQNIKKLPAASTVTEIIKRHNLIPEEESLKRQSLIRFERIAPNDLWQMDFKGHFQLGIKKTCYPLTIVDDHSRFSPCLYACGDQSLLTVKKQLINVFQQYGMPLQINADNGSPWGNSSLVKHTQLTVWLLQLGILVTHSRPRHPQTNGKIERFHRTLKEDLITKQRIDNYTHAQKLFNQWRKIYNYERPHEGINMLAPADRYIPSQRMMPERLPKIEYDDFAIVRKTNSRGAISHMGTDFHVGKAFSGHHLEVRYDEVFGLLEVYFGKHKIYTCGLG
jgi:transposase InsO family protein